ncbi:RYamide [Haematobia irritans]|uniref:RYamide n=1 Tax=Haematobia irritans TaxID=7368 RepID=UPI003F508506
MINIHSVTSKRMSNMYVCIIIPHTPPQHCTQKVKKTEEEDRSANKTKLFIIALATCCCSNNHWKENICSNTNFTYAQFMMFHFTSTHMLTLRLSFSTNLLWIFGFRCFIEYIQVRDGECVCARPQTGCSSFKSVHLKRAKKNTTYIRTHPEKQTFEYKTSGSICNTVKSYRCNEIIIVVIASYYCALKHQQPKMFDNKSFWPLTILLLAFYFMLVQCTPLEPSDQFLDNPSDGKTDLLTMQKRPSFFVGSRYGRSSGGSSSSSSGGGGAYAPSKTRRLNVVPRNDRFFLGSRYGKRAGTQNAKQQHFLDSMLATPYEQALFSEISTGTQLSNKPEPLMFNSDNFHGDNNALDSDNGPSSPFYMSCVYTGLQNFYRCDSIDDNNIFYVKNTVKNSNGYTTTNDDDSDADSGNDGDKENGNVKGNEDKVLLTGSTNADFDVGTGVDDLNILVNETAEHNEDKEKN